MKISRLFCGQYLSAAIPPAAELAALLTARGLEVEAITPVAVADGIIVGEIKACEPHPNADRLQRCTVDTGGGKSVALVCGAPNARVGLRVAVALAGESALGGQPLQARDIRGISSPGMICSAAELGIGSDKSGVAELAVSDGEIGDCLHERLLLNDEVLDINITPNRGDCLSHLGIAREIAAAIGCKVVIPPPPAVADDDAKISVHIDERAARSACPYYGGLIVSAADCAAAVPWWLRTLIERCGERSVSTVVDITNYMMLALGQPLHAFDLDRLEGGIHVRYAADGEQLTVLDGSDVVCTADTLLIADETRALALAGVMGGADSGITAASKNVLLEAAHFSMSSVAGVARRFKLNSEAAFRFERGVDFQLPPLALQHAAVFIRQLCGGSVGQLVNGGQMPAVLPPIKVAVPRIERVLGIEIKAPAAAGLLEGIQLPVTVQDDGASIEIAVPSWRFDLKIPEDIIEEVIRLHGYDNLPETMPRQVRALQQQLANPTLADDARTFFAERGFYEVITYSFVPQEWEAGLAGAGAQPLALLNPMSEEMAVMRTTLWGGLLDRALYNSLQMQGWQESPPICLFEIGRCFHPAREEGLPYQPMTVAGVIQGQPSPTQWAAAAREFDFYDIKGVIEMFLARYEVSCRAAKADEQPGLHLGKAAVIELNGRCIGALGELHPGNPLWQAFRAPPFLFTVDLDALAAGRGEARRQVQPIPRFPVLSRDVALIADADLPAGELLAAARAVAGAAVLEVQLFDHYIGDGKHIAAGKKSCGIRFVLQGQDANLTGEEIEDTVQGVVKALKEKYSLELRDG